MVLNSFQPYKTSKEALNTTLTLMERSHFIV